MPGKVKDQEIDTTRWDTARMISIGHIAKTYGMLPSQVRDHATTFDIMITDVYSTWERVQMDKASGKAPSMDNFKKEDLLEVLKRTQNGG
jgi:hypothetical protein